MAKNRLAIGFILLAGALFLSGSDAPAGLRETVAPPYPLKTLSPAGFGVFAGILDVIPVSGTSSVAFAANKNASSGAESLMSLQISKTGVCSAARTFESGKGNPRCVAALWIASSTSGPSGAGGYGLVYVLFTQKLSNPTRWTATVQVAKFNSAGLRTGSWRQIWTTTTPNGTYVAGPSLFAHNRGDLIGVVFGLSILDIAHFNVKKGIAYFVEASLPNGYPTGNPAPINIYGDGSYVGCWVYRPAWNGSFWLVPVATEIYKSPGAWADFQQVEALVFAVSPISPHYSNLTVINYSLDNRHSFGELWLAPFPGTEADYWLFVRKTEVIAEAQQRLDQYKYSFSLQRLNWNAAVVQTKKLALGNLVHQLTYDPAYVFYDEADYFTPIIASDETGTPQLFISRQHTLDLYKKNTTVPPHRYEHQFILYAVNAKTGASTWKNWSVTLWPNLQAGGVAKPRIFVFPGGALAVVNSHRYMSSPYGSMSTFSTFPDWVK